MVLYLNLPGNLESLYPGFLDSQHVFTCRGLPGFWEAALPRGWVRPPNRSYVYVAGLRADDPGDCLLVFERPGNHRGPGGNVLYAGAHVSYLNSPPPDRPGQLKELLDQTRAAVKKRGGEIRLVGE